MEKLGFVLGIVLYFILDGLKISKIITVFISILIGWIVYLYIKYYQLKVNMNHTNQWISMTNQSIEKFMKEKQKIQNCMHDMKNQLYEIKSLCEQKDYKKIEQKIDAISMQCTKLSTSSISTNMVLDTFLSKFISNHPQLQYDIKINVPDSIQMKTNEFSSFLICLLKDEFIKQKGNMTIHMNMTENELVSNIFYPNEIKMEEDCLFILETIVNQYHGKLKIKENQINCILFL